MGGTTSRRRTATGSPGTQRGGVQGLPLRFRRRTGLLCRNGNAPLGLQRQGNASQNINVEYNVAHCTGNYVARIISLTVKSTFYGDKHRHVSTLLITIPTASVASR